VRLSKIMLQNELFDTADAGTGICLVPGLTLFRQHLGDAEQRALAGEIADAVSKAPWFIPHMPRSGRPFSVKMTNCGPLGWVSDRDGGYRYQAAHPETAKAWPPIPPLALRIWWALASCPHPPEACLVNFYDCHARMGLHQDRDEAERAAPVVSVSLGESCCFRYGGLRRGDPARKLELNSGDVLVMGGAALAEFRRDLVRPAGLRSERRNAHQVWVIQVRVILLIDVFVDNGDLPVRGRKSGQDQQTQRFPNPVVIPAAVFDIRQAHQRVTRVNQTKMQLAQGNPSF
jgi:DNA oxidative demethylase